MRRKEWIEPKSHGYLRIPVLHFLWGQPYDALARNILAALRPSRVIISAGSITCDTCLWRVTVYVDALSRVAGSTVETIKRIEQEVDVGVDQETQNGASIETMLRARGVEIRS